jgi:hypothetical protein
MPRGREQVARDERVRQHDQPGDGHVMLDVVGIADGQRRKGEQQRRRRAGNLAKETGAQTD